MHHWANQVRGPLRRSVDTTTLWSLLLALASGLGSEAAASPMQAAADEVVARAGGGRRATSAHDTVPLAFTPLGPEQSGLAFRHRAGRAGLAKRLMVECVGAGLGLVDLDDDGDLDVYLVQGGDVDDDGHVRGALDALFLNDGLGVFAPGPDGDRGRGFGFGVTAGDVDGDGDEDLFVADLGPNELLLNDGRAGLTSTPDASGLAGAADDWSMSGAFGDPDRDGDLDLYVTNYLLHDPSHPLLDGMTCRWMGCEVPCGPKGLPTQADRFHLNDGNGHFEDATAACGLADVPAGYAFQAVFCDLDDDGDADLFVANDSVPNACFVNEGLDDQGRPRFVERGMEAGLALSDSGKEQAGMGVAVGDLDGDLRPDLVLTNFSREANGAFLNASVPGYGVLFFDEANATGLGRPSYFDLGWGASLLDVDLDGDLDLFVANGHVYPQVEECGLSDTTFAQRDKLFEQVTPGRFRLASVAGLDAALASRGSAAGDLDGDGDEDLLVAELDGPVRLLRNDSLRAGAWCSLDLRPLAASVGARVLLRQGDRVRADEVHRGSSFLSTEDRRLHFGLTADGDPVWADVRWPDGRWERFGPLAPDRVQVLTRGSGDPLESAPEPARGER